MSEQVFSYESSTPTELTDGTDAYLRMARPGLKSYEEGVASNQAAQLAEQANTPEVKLFTLPEQVISQTSLRLVEFRRLAKEDYAQAA